MKRWTVDLPDLWLLFVPWHFPLDKDESIEGASVEAEAEFKKRFPAIYKHLLAYKDQLMDRNRAETGVRYEWYALQRWGSEYWHEFDRPKILYQEIATYQAFGWDDRSHFTNNKTFLIPDASHFLLGVLNSRPCWWFLSQVAQKMVGGALAMQTPYVEQIPIPSASKSVESQITSIVGEILERKKKDVNSFVDELDAQNDGLVAHLYGLTEEEFRIILEDLALNDPVRVGAINAYRDMQRSFAK